jgi:uncharacterized protein (UPF0276 family)
MPNPSGGSSSETPASFHVPPGADTATPTNASPQSRRARAGVAVPDRAGIGLRAPHYREVLQTLPAVGWFEVHSENYFGDGGQPLYYLERIRSHYPVSLHGVGLSLGRADELDVGHLRLLKRLVDRIEPGLVSEHLCWGAGPQGHLNDLLPLPYTEEALRVVCAHVDQTQTFLGRSILMENISSYLRYTHSTIPEWEFVAEVAQRTGCGVLLDVNNIYVSACNHGFDAHQYLRAIAPHTVGEIHLAGFDRVGELLVDTHGSRVFAEVWRLFAAAVARVGRVPALIEWDTDLPDLAVLLEEAAIAQSMLEQPHALAA